MNRHATLTAILLTATMTAAPTPSAAGATVAGAPMPDPAALGFTGVRSLKAPPTPIDDAPKRSSAAPVDCLVSGTSLQPHAPITIESDADFASPLSGVRSGSGTPEDPYVISGWLITGQGIQLGQAIDEGLLLPGAIPAIQITGTTKHVVVRQNVISGTGFPQGYDFGVYLESASNVTLERNTICSTILDGAIAITSENVLYRENDVLDTRVGLRALSSPGIRMHKNTVRDSVWGIATEDSMAPVITENTIEALYNTGILTAYADGVVLTGNTVRRSPNGDYLLGIFVYDADRAVVTDNQVTGGLIFGYDLAYVTNGVIERNASLNNWFGLYLWDDWVPGDNVVRENRVERNGYGGILVQDTDFNVVESNVVEGNGSHGIWIWATDDVGTSDTDRTRGTVIRGIASNDSGAGHGFAFWGDEGTLLRDSSARRNGGGGIWLLNSTADIQGIAIEDNGGTGIEIDGAVPGAGATVTGNTLRSNLRGIVLENATGHRLRGNVLEGNTYGFGIEGVTDDHFVANDIDASNTVDGRPVMILENATGTLDWGALDPGYLALVFPHDLVVRGVDVQGSVHGLVVFGGTNVRIDGGRFVDVETAVDLLRSVDASVVGASFARAATGVRVLGDALRNRVEGNSHDGGSIGVKVAAASLPGVGYEQPAETVVSGNTIVGVGTVGVENGGENTSVRGNRITMAGGSGISTMSAPIVIEDNVIDGAGDRGIDVFTLFTTLRRNSVSGFDRGISVWYASGIVVEDNRVTGNTVGYYQQGGADQAKILRNVASGNDQGVVINGEVNDVVFECNRVTGNDDDGVRFGTLTVRTRITRNLIEGNGVGLSMFGILSQIQDNRIAKNGVGVRMAGALIPSNPLSGNNIEGNTTMGMEMFTAGTSESIVSVGGTTETATNNWWGHAMGPRAAGNPTGMGDRVGDQVQYRPWLTSPDADAGACGASLPA